jgi:hypothetical protein
MKYGLVTNIVQILAIYTRFHYFYTNNSLSSGERFGPVAFCVIYLNVCEFIEMFPVILTIA